jgi:hypothetical protein
MRRSFCNCTESTSASLFLHGRFFCETEGQCCSARSESLAQVLLLTQWLLVAVRAAKPVVGNDVHPPVERRNLSAGASTAEV